MPSVVVPITSGTNQTVTCTLPVNGGNVTLTFSFTWNDVGDYWFMSITDNNGNLLLDAIPVITGQYPAADILRQYQYLNIGSAYLVPASAGLPDNPSFDDLGSDYLLVWTDNEGYLSIGA
ncbi:phage baseplate plug family protein [Alicyclobacillus sendaiensis]|uniref:phage baseplate plug family protein n=1 Tax=Alicyclobacillus sendaiensis TaxID=192387 RepID=UPI00078503A3|nr:hypothetical protein [Alicyclobacillus sendaiensis]